MVYLHHSSHPFSILGLLWFNLIQLDHFFERWKSWDRNAHYSQQPPLMVIAKLGAVDLWRLLEDCQIIVKPGKKHEKVRCRWRNFIHKPNGHVIFPFVVTIFDSGIPFFGGQDICGIPPSIDHGFSQFRWVESPGCDDMSPSLSEIHMIVG